jgi:hypothetical protein
LLLSKNSARSIDIKIKSQNPTKKDGALTVPDIIIEPTNIAVLIYPPSSVVCHLFYRLVLMPQFSFLLLPTRLFLQTLVQ